MLWIRATVEMSNPQRRTSSSPACGPVPVTTVPVTIASAVSVPTAAASRRSVAEPGTASATGSAGSPMPRCAVHGDEAERDRRHRQQEVRLHERRVQVGAHGDAAHHPVGEHGDEHQDRRDDEPVLPGARPSRPDPERSDRHRQGRDADEPAEQAVHLLDRSVPARHVDERLIVAVRPVVAAEATTGQPHDATGDDQQAQTRHRDDRQLTEPANAERPAVGASSVDDALSAFALLVRAGVIGDDSTHPESRI